MSYKFEFRIFYDLLSYHALNGKFSKGFEIDNFLKLGLWFGLECQHKDISLYTLLGVFSGHSSKLPSFRYFTTCNKVHNQYIQHTPLWCSQYILVHYHLSGTIQPSRKYIFDIYIIYIEYTPNDLLITHQFIIYFKRVTTLTTAHNKYWHALKQGWAGYFFGRIPDTGYPANY